MKNSKKLNLGCGLDIIPDYVNLDSLNLKGVDIVHDLNKFPYPFKDNTFEYIFTSHVLEHLDDIVKVMAELKRISKPGAIIRIRVPHFSCGVSYRDPTHKRLFSYHTFDYFTSTSFYGLPNFNILRRKLNFTRLAFPSLNKIFNPIININPTMYERFFCWILPSAELLIDLEVTK
jgi:SAM-dependent methyltransferase